MNLQATHPDPWISAVAMDDKRVSKMTLETAQMYCTATGFDAYLPTHVGHPLIDWVRLNLSWLVRFHHALAGEHFYRTGNIHKSFQDVGQFMDIPMFAEPNSFRNHARSPHDSPRYHNDGDGYDLMRMDYTDIDDVHYAYRCYLRARWRMDVRAAQWTRRAPPFWLDEQPPQDYHRPQMLRSTEIVWSGANPDQWTSIITEGMTAWTRKRRLKRGFPLHSNSRKRVQR